MGGEIYMTARETVMPTADDKAAFDKMWTNLETGRMRRAAAPEDKLKPIFRQGRTGYQQFYVDPACGYTWQCWCLSEYVNAAGYFLLWLRGRKAKAGSMIIDGKPMAAKDRSVLMRRVEKYQAASWEKARAKQQAKKATSFRAGKAIVAFKL